MATEPEEYNANYLDRQHSAKVVSQFPVLKKLLLQLFAPLFSFSLVQTIFPKAFISLCARIGRTNKTGNVQPMLEFLIPILQSNRFRRESVYRWWFLLRLMVVSLQHRKNKFNESYLECEDQIVPLATNGPKPHSGYDVSYIYVAMALWLFERNEIEKAMSYAITASEADDTWGYPSYILGWISLFSEESGTLEHNFDDSSDDSRNDLRNDLGEQPKTVEHFAVKHFVKAARHEWSFLQKMKNDKIVQQFPEVINAVQQKLLVTSGTDMSASVD